MELPSVIVDVLGPEVTPALLFSIMLRWNSSFPYEKTCISLILCPITFSVYPTVLFVTLCPYFLSAPLDNFS